MSSSHNNNNQTNNIKGGVKDNKIRKRNCSSSSSSSLARKYRFKRAILVGKKGGTTTPVPLWKTSATSSPSMDTTTTEQLFHSSASGLPFKDKEKEVSVSARKLAATLWEMNDLIPSRVKKEFEVDQMRTCKETSMKSREKAVSLSRSGLLRSQMSDPCNSPTAERMKGFESDGYRRTVSGLSHPHRSGVDAHISSSSIEENCYKNKDGVKSRLKEARSGLSTSKKILKVLNQMCHREKQSSTMALVLALGSELERVCGQVDKLIQEERSNSNQYDAEYMMKRFAEETAWKTREREKVHDAIKNVSEELKVEKKLRAQTERLNKKIAIEMASVKASHLEVCKELEREKRAKEILEQVCDELARGIGEDRAHVEELKKESVKVLEEVEKEREMLQLADILREERVQMKLSEAKYQFEEKNDFLEKLRNELEDFMRIRDEENGDVSPESTKFNDLETYFNTICQGIRNADKLHDSDEEGSDLVSIELNMNNDSRGYDWSYTNEKDAQNDSKRVSTDKESTGRKSFSERIQWGSICFNKRNSSFKKRDLDINIQEGCDHSDPDTSNEFLSRARIQDDKEGTPSNRSISGANPVQRKDQQLILQCTNEEAEENILLAFEGANLKQEAEVKKPRCYLKSFDSDS
ncbi:uncharacterized protein At5g41620-like [Vicia villosa]|uniref:uncharacterized protein At5g41620-like n=1 Tax=Vicia villosa TaxID=3911 RepID=UPI00273C214D|nr:uncharacterized protein At5g41620-like [Vicia villosa]